MTAPGALAPANVTIDSHLTDERLETMARDVRDGLGRAPKELPPKYFYDARGSELFDQITRLLPRLDGRERSPESVDQVACAWPRT